MNTNSVPRTTPAGALTAPRPATPAQPVPELVRRALAAFDAARDDRMRPVVKEAAREYTRSG